MSNKQALMFLGFVLVMALAIGQAAHLTPTGRIHDGFRLMLRQALRGMFYGTKAALAAVFNTIWVMETAKTLFGAVLLSGAGVAAYLFVNPADAERMATTGTVTGFVVFGILTMLATRRVEQLREAQATADEARRHAEFAAMLAAALKKH